ncbi:PIN domain-containing protein [Actinophytocola sp.]|uniref:type II toxin-antitoxin system VapC family toxin n=1 Tax=Actinophytocola sp. TaxID=1872138 RepID=UPI002D7F15EF|nr:PIN domain-containing protein [Actinophytocola sp.]HET9142868.1 PIN domain-containing protein [Actinophytocola sp.]
MLDTSVLLGLLDTGDAHHQAAARAVTQCMVAGSDFGLPASVLAEVLVSEARRSRPAVEQRRIRVLTLFGPVRPIDEAVAVHSAQLRARHPSLRLPDALVLATGIVDDAELVLTADKRWAGLDKRVRLLDSG